jgi:3-deoxy-D-manno-octulosonic-acid transferase
LPLVLARLWWRGRREPGYRQHIGERLAFVPHHKGDAPLIWLHAVSVGETRAAEPLIDLLLATYPLHQLLLTHMTPTGRATGAALFAHYGARVRQAYLPYDIGWTVERFLVRNTPQICLLMETEIWPNLMARCAVHQVPVVLVNARLSERSLKKARRLGSLMIDAAKQLRMVGAQTQADAERIRSLGVADVDVTGSIKFDVAPSAQMLALGHQLRQQIGNRPVLLCASTRDGEEAMILDALDASNLPPSTLLIIVPRNDLMPSPPWSRRAAYHCSVVRRSAR